jgi:hypothetical protein
MANFLSNIVTAITNYQYKFVTALVGFFAMVFLYDGLPGAATWVLYPMGLFAGIIIGYMIYGIYCATINSWNGGQKGLAILYGSASVIFFGFVIYLLITKHQ